MSVVQITGLADRLFAALAGRPEPADPVADWASLTESGLDRLLMPEAEGGAGDAHAEACAVLESYGRHGLSLPLLETMAANRLLAESGVAAPPAPRALLVPAAEGLLRLDPGDRLFLTASVALPFAGMAAEIVAVARDRAGAPFVVRVAPPRAAKPGRSIADEPLLVVPPAELEPLADPRPLAGRIEPALALPPLLQAAAISGAVAAATDLALAHANQRVQFGRPIAAFPAVQDMAVRLAEAAVLCRVAVATAARHAAGAQALWHAAQAKATASEAAGIAAAEAHQLHGAIGFTREYALHRFTRRLWDWRERYGHESFWHGVIGQHAIDGASQALWPLLCNDGPR